MRLFACGLATAACALLSSPAADATDYYMNHFTSVTQQAGHACTAADPGMQWSTCGNLMGPGDRLLLNPGLYTVNFLFQKSGSAGNYITIQCNTPVPTTPGSDGQCILDASRDPVTGTTNRSIELQYAGGVETAQYASYLDFENLEVDNGAVSTNGSGWRWDTGTHVGQSPVSVHHHIIMHHITSQNSTCFAVQVQDVDYFIGGYLVGKNTGAACSNASGSGGEFYQFVDVDAQPGFHNVIYNSIWYNNRYGTQAQSDGNGLIIDDNHHTQGQMATNAIPPYKAWTLVFNNMAFNNDGKGIHVYLSDNVVAVHNTLIDNIQKSRFSNQAIVDAQGSNIQYYNNILVSTGEPYFYGTGGGGGWEDYNLYIGSTCVSGRCAGTAGVALDASFTGNVWGGNNVAGNPNLPYNYSAPPTTEAAAIAALTPPSSSPARNAGACYWAELATLDGSNFSDINGVLRNLSSCALKPTMGAIQVQ